MGWRRWRRWFWLLCSLCGASSQTVSAPDVSVIRYLWNKVKTKWSITCVSPQLLWHLGGKSPSRTCGRVSVFIGKVLPVLPAVLGAAQQPEHWLWLRIGQHLHGRGPHTLRPAGDVNTQAAHHWKSSFEVGVWVHFGYLILAMLIWPHTRFWFFFFADGLVYIS